MPALVDRPRRSVAGVLALLCGAVIVLSACDTTSEAPAGGGGSGEVRRSEEPRSGETRPSERRTTEPTRPSEYNPNNCPTGLVC